MEHNLNRVINVKAIDIEGNYQPIDLEEEYTLAGPAFTIISCGDGNDAFQDIEIDTKSSVLDYMSVIAYFNKLSGNVDRYKFPNDHIVLVG